MYRIIERETQDIIDQNLSYDEAMLYRGDESLEMVEQIDESGIVWLKPGDHFIHYDGTEYEVVSGNEKWRDSDSPIRSWNESWIRAKEVRPPVDIIEMLEGVADYLICANKFWIKEVL